MVSLSLASINKAEAANWDPTECPAKYILRRGFLKKFTRVSPSVILVKDIASKTRRAIVQRNVEKTIDLISYNYSILQSLILNHVQDAKRDSSE